MLALIQIRAFSGVTTKRQSPESLLSHAKIMTFPFLCVLGLLVLLLLPGIYALFLPSDASIFLPDYKKSGVPPVFIAFQFNYPQALALGISRRLHVLPEWLTYVVGCTRTPLSPPRYNKHMVWSPISNDIMKIPYHSAESRVVLGRLASPSAPFSVSYRRHTLTPMPY